MGGSRRRLVTASRDWTARVWALTPGGSGSSNGMAAAGMRAPGGMLAEAEDGAGASRCLSVLTGHGGPLTSLQVGIGLGR